MEMIAGIVVGVVVVAGLLWFFLFRGKGEEALPKEAERPAPTKKAERPPKKAEPSPEKAKKPEAKPAEKPAPKKAEAKPEKKPEPDEAEEEAEEEEAPAEEPAAEAAPAEPEPEPEPAPAAEPSKEDVAALRSGLDKTRGGFIARIANLFRKKKEIDPELLDELQEVLITADVGVKTSEKILEQLRKRMDNAELDDEDKVWEALREEAMAILEVGAHRAPRVSESPSLILVVGVNGVGKTTTIGKLAARYKEDGKQVILAAGDTFRAAAVPQLEVWGRRVGCDVVKGKRKADPASVIFDAVKKAQEDEADVVIADTAGRLHTKSNLMEELKKVARSGEKALGRPVDEILLVLDSTTGQNAIAQAQQFRDAIDVTAIALTKLDGTAKGGVILGIVDEHGLPVHFVGIGERVEDLREFHAPTFVKALFAKPDDETLAA